MNKLGYYRYPTIYNDTIVFVSEGDLWSVSLKKGGVPQRLTAGKGSISHPKFSPDGKHLAFSSSEEGHLEAYVMPSNGGTIKRLTFLGDNAQVLDWTEQGIIFSSATGHPWERVNRLFTIDPKGGAHTLLPFGIATHVSYSQNNKCVIQRHGYREFSFWKRYRGGTAGTLWIDSTGKGDFKKLIDVKGNISRALWINNRIYFASDHEGLGNIYSCNISGKDLQRHTHHEEYYVRNLSTDNRHIVYHAGGNLHAYNLNNQEDRKIKVECNSPRSQRNRKFISAAKYLEDFAIHPQGHHLASVARGKAFCFSNWEGPALQFEASATARHRLARWLNDGKRLLVVTDEDGEETLAIYDAETTSKLKELIKSDIGRVLDLKVSPTKDEAVFTNHRSELIHINLKNSKITRLDRSKHGAIAGFNWSPDGNWLAYNCSKTRHTSIIKMVNPKKATPIEVTKPVLRDVSPAFDPDGNYLYFLSYRQFNPTWDTLQFEMGFPRGMKPYLITLQKDLPLPFRNLPSKLEVKEPKKEANKSKVKSITIDFDGIQDRICAFPVNDGTYSQIAGLKGKVLFSSIPITGTLDHEDDEHDSKAKVEIYDFETQKSEVILKNVTEFQLSQNLECLAYRTDNKLRVIKAGEKPSDQNDS